MTMVVGTTSVDSMALAPTNQTSQTELTSQDFWKLLVSQLQTQDPFEPAGTEAMLEQFLALQSAGQMEQISAGLEKLQALLLLGQSVGATLGGATQNGTVVGVSLSGDPSVTVQLGENLVTLPLSDVSEAKSTTGQPLATWA